MRDTRKKMPYWAVAIREKNEEIAYLEEALVRALTHREERAGINASSLLNSYLELALMRYSAGEDLALVAETFLDAIDRGFSRYIEDHPPNTALSMQFMSYSKLNRLFSMLVLNQASQDQAQRFIRSYEAYLQAGEATPDSICARFTQALSGTSALPQAETVHWEKAYGTLWEALSPSTPDAKRPASLHEFLKAWYRKMHGSRAAQTGRLKQQYNSYAGYWCLEAAAAVVILDIDDSSFRDNVYYPKDWADWARTSRA